MEGLLASHLPPVSLTLRRCRGHLCFLLAGFELLAGLDNLAGVVLTGRTVPEREIRSQHQRKKDFSSLPTNYEAPLANSHLRLRRVIQTLIFTSIIP